MCKNWFIKKPSEKIIPDSVSDEERLVRFILSPIHFKKDGRTMRTSAFNPTPGSEEISVTRLDYSSIEKCKELAHIIGSGKNQYRGFGLLNKRIVLESGGKDVVPFPVKDNPAHANILLGIVRQGDCFPAELLFILDNLLKKTAYFEDPNPNSPNWEGAPLSL